MLRFAVNDQGAWLPRGAKARLLGRNKSFVNNKQELVLVCQTTRSQLKNRREVVQKLTDMLDDSGLPDVMRNMRDINFVSEGTKKKNLEHKKRTSDKKKSRGNFKGDY